MVAKIEKPHHWPSAGKTDPVNAYFKTITWINSQRKGIISMPGYSKPLLGIESPDKTIVLERMLIRLINNGYIFGKSKKYGDPTICMEIFINGNFRGDPDEKICTLYPTHWQMGKNQEWIENFRFTGFLKRLYAQVKDGQMDLTQLLHKGNPKTIDQLLDPTKKRFNTHEELYEFVEKSIREGINRKHVYAFLTKYQELHELKS